MVTFATPNGGNSASTGHQNSNNNASANAQTSNYSSGGGHPTAGVYATYTAAAVKAAPTPKTPTYASPHEQGQNNTKTTTTKAANTTTNNTTNNNYIENAYEDDWIKTWADTFAATSDLNLSSLNTSFLDSSQRNAEVPVYILSARASDEVREQAAAAAANGYIRKPLDHEVLACNVRQTVTSTRWFSYRTRG